MSTRKNTAIKVQTDIVSDVERLTYAIEEGSIVQTETGYWIVRDGAWVNLNSSDAQGLGWVRWDDDEHTSSSKLTFANGVAALLPNNGATITIIPKHSNRPVQPHHRSCIRHCRERYLHLHGGIQSECSKRTTNLR
jgi:hypothetical protein